MSQTAIDHKMHENIVMYVPTAVLRILIRLLQAKSSLFFITPILLIAMTKYTFIGSLESEFTFCRKSQKIGKVFCKACRGSILNGARKQFRYKTAYIKEKNICCLNASKSDRITSQFIEQGPSNFVSERLKIAIKEEKYLCFKL